MNAVADGLFVGTIDDAENAMLLRNHRVDAIVSLTHASPDTPNLPVFRIPMVDGPQNDAQAFDQAVLETLELLNEGDRVLVHCSAGASRSPAVAATAFALYDEIDLETAFEQVANRREAVDPHEAVVRQAARVYDQYRE